MAGRYRVVYADPPWRFRTWSETNQVKAVSRHYNLMETDAIVEMRSLLIGAPTDGPGAGFAADDCCLFLWAIRPMLPQALEVGSAWGFEYKTVAFTWVKTGKTDPEKRPIGLGYWTRANPEYCLLFTRGNPQRRVGATGVRELIETGDEPDTIWDPRREHSRKPDAIYSGIEALVEGPYVELFARQSWPGWDCWERRLVSLMTMLRCNAEPDGLH